MIGALIISNFCLILMIKGVSTWIAVVLSFVYVICNCVALILWEETKDRIRVIENKLIKKGGEG